MRIDVVFAEHAILTKIKQKLKLLKLEPEYVKIVISIIRVKKINAPDVLRQDIWIILVKMKKYSRKIVDIAIEKWM